MGEGKMEADSKDFRVYEGYDYSENRPTLKDSGPKNDPDQYAFSDSISDINDEIQKLLIKKRCDYGDSFERIWDKFGPLSVVIRLNDKIERLNNLTINTFHEPKNESIEDTFKDIIGYCLLALRKMRLDKI